jgi:Family of unknown function (DUF6236)
MSSGISLYYPYIHITDEGWLKRSLLYWDKVRRIVPAGSPPDDCGDCYRAAEEQLLLATSPTPYLSEAAQRFRAKIPALLEEIRQRGESLEFEDPAAAARDQGLRIHLEKMEDNLRSFLVSEQIVHVQGDWIVSHPDLADWYMTCLATVMSEKIGSPIVTDFQKNNAIGEYLTHANPTSGETSPDRVMAMLRLRIPFPDTDKVAEVPLREIMEFREKYADQRRNLRDSLEELMKEVPTISDKNDLCDHLHDKQARLDQAIAEHRKAADRFYAKTIPSVLQISVPTGPLALAAALHAPPLTLAVLGTGAVALLALGWWAKFKDDERTMEAKPYQYLLTLERRFGSNA